jgi:hypothetical protein
MGERSSPFPLRQWSYRLHLAQDSHRKPADNVAGFRIAELANPELRCERLCLG